MSIPLDNLYNWVDSLLPDPAILYVFQPHGSKKISDCNWFRNHNIATAYRFPGVIAHDQEPLDWNFYNNQDYNIKWYEHNFKYRAFAIFYCFIMWQPGLRK